MEKRIHEEEDTYSTPVNFHWIRALEEIIKEGIRNLTKENKLILRNIVDSNSSTNGKFLTLSQLEVKKRKQT